MVGSVLFDSNRMWCGLAFLLDEDVMLSLGRVVGLGITAINVCVWALLDRSIH